MNSVKSPSDLYCEQCLSRIKLLTDAAETFNEELYQNQLQFLNSNKDLLRDMKMISAHTTLLWMLVDYKIRDKTIEIKKQGTKDVKNLVEEILNHIEDEDLRFSTALSRLHVYFMMSTIYSLLKPCLNVIVSEQCYWEAKEITKSIETRTMTEKNDIHDLWTNIELVHNLRFFHTFDEVEDHTINLKNQMDQSKKSNMKKIHKNFPIITVENEETVSVVSTPDTANSTMVSSKLISEEKVQLSTTSNIDEEPANNQKANKTSENKFPASMQSKQKIYPTIYRPVMLPTMAKLKPISSQNVPIIINKISTPFKKSMEDDEKIELKQLPKLVRPQFDYY